MAEFDETRHSGLLLGLNLPNGDKQPVSLCLNRMSQPVQAFSPLSSRHPMPVNGFNPLFITVKDVSIHFVIVPGPRFQLSTMVDAG
jgi:hypothetical protein